MNLFNILQDPEEWKEKGKCWGKTTSPATDLWFPEPEEPKDIQRSKKLLAKSICKVCPVVEECLRYAIVNEESFGIWGGKTIRERASIAKQWRVDGLIK